MFLCERTTNDTNILTTGQEEKTKKNVSTLHEKIIKIFFLSNNLRQQNFNQYGIQVKKIKHLFLGLHFVCY